MDGVSFTVRTRRACSASSGRAAAARASPRSRSCASSRERADRGGEHRAPPATGAGATSPPSTRRARRSAIDPRQGDRDGLPGADDLAQPGLHRRRPDHGGRSGSTRAASKTEARGARHRDARARWGCPTPEQRLDEYPIELSRRHAPARDDRHGAACEPTPAHRGRADHRPRRDRAGADPRAAARLQARARHGAAAHHPRPGGGGGDVPTGSS